MDHLAREIVSNVLSRLPVKDLMRYKCVCKSWFDLITDPHFISNHYHFYNSLKEQEHLLLLRTPTHSLVRVNTDISILSWNPNEPKRLASSSSYVLNPPPDQYGCWSYIMGPCNGIYFLWYDDRGIIMNPSLRQFITLPPRPHFPKPRGTSYSDIYPRFGFDPKTNDYKVVIIRKLWIKFEVMTKWTVELYSLNSNSWKIFEDNPIPFPFARLSNTSRVFTYVNNCCHWWGCLHKSDTYESDDVESGKDESDDVECAVLSFDMVSGLFRKIKMPKMPIITPYASTPKFHQNLINLTINSDKNIIPFRESTTIGIIDYYNVNQGIDFYNQGEACFCFDLWIMKDYWDEGSWIKLYSVCPIPVIYRKLLGYYGSNQYLWFQANKRLVLLSGLDPEENTRDLLVCGVLESVIAVKYMESLVSLQRGTRF